MGTLKKSKKVLGQETSCKGPYIAQEMAQKTLQILLIYTSPQIRKESRSDNVDCWSWVETKLRRHSRLSVEEIWIDGRTIGWTKIDVVGRGRRLLNVSRLISGFRSICSRALDLNPSLFALRVSRRSTQCYWLEKRGLFLGKPQRFNRQFGCRWTDTRIPWWIQHQIQNDSCTTWTKSNEDDFDCFNDLGRRIRLGTCRDNNWIWPHW